MTNEELFKRADDLAARAEKTGSVTHTAFLTPAEQYALRAFRPRGDCRMVFSGGVAGTERQCAFFLPDWMEEDAFDPSETIRCIRITAHFGAPGHRDYLGALLGMGVGREWIGDILIQDSVAHVLCIQSVEAHLLGIEKVGRCGVKTAAVALTDVPVPERRVKELSFTVQSPRLDAVLSGLFHLSRTQAAERIRAGDASLNYAECLRPDAEIRPGDIVSLRGYGKAEVKDLGGQSRKGRTYLTGEVYL